MKKTVFLFALCLLGFTKATVAQKVFEKNMEYNNQYIEMEVPFASEIEVKTWDKPNVYFKATISTEDPEHLDLYTIMINNGKKVISIKSETEEFFDALHEKWKKNSNKKSYYITNKQYDFNYVLYVPNNATFRVSSINGDMKSNVIQGDFEAELINGNIEIAKFSGNLDLSTINGEIDLNVANADFVAETIHGDIYADGKLKVKSYDRHVGQKVESVNSSSSTRLKLNTINGNMYLRL